MHGQVNSHCGGHLGRKNSMNPPGRAIAPERSKSGVDPCPPQANV
jgi:hypothetical protein